MFQSLNGFNLFFPSEWEDWEYEGCHRWRFPPFWHQPRAPQGLLQANLLKELFSHPDPNMEKLLATWQAELGINITIDFPTHIQSKWDQPLLKKASSDLFHPLTEKHDQARWRAVTAQHAGDWLHPLPITSCGMRLSDEALRVAVGLGLGANICVPPTCACGAFVSVRASTVCLVPWVSVVWLAMM